MTRDPVSYQLWANDNLGKKHWQSNQTQYITTTILPRKVLSESKGLKKTKYDSLFHLHPLNHSKFPCTLMVVENLAYPQWISVGCDEKLLISFACFVDNKIENHTSVENLLSRYSCNVDGYFLKSQQCYKFQWGNLSSPLSEKLIKQKRSALTSGTEEQFAELKRIFFSATSGKILPVIFTSASNVCLHIYENYYGQFLFESFHFNVSSFKNVSGYLLFKEQPNTYDTFLVDNLRKCAKHGFLVSSQYMCDAVRDCGDGDDSDDNSPICDNAMQGFIDGFSKECSPLFYKDPNGMCKTFVDMKTKEGRMGNVPVFSCHNNFLISAENLDDLVGDCGPLAEDEPLYWKLAIFRSFSRCDIHGQLPCKPGHSRCYKMSDICVYQFSKNGLLKPCRNGGHIVNCKEFECNMKYKCPAYYCIPFGYMCDGQWDCPHGDDEEDTCGPSRVCRNMFKCRKSQLCLHLHDVCDENFDCPQNDDESLCNLLGVSCPDVCSCLNYAILCSEVNISYSALNDKFPYFSLHISFTAIASSRFLLNWKHLKRLYVSSNDVQDICGTANLLTLLISFIADNNSVLSLNESCFSNIRTIQVISLNKNKISVMKQNSFSNLPKVCQIDISENQLYHLYASIFWSVPNIKKISLHGNFFTNIDVDAFKYLHSLTIVNTDDYQICCIKPPKAECTAVCPWYVSCNYLLPDESMVIVLSVVCAVILLLNAVSLGNRIYSLKHEHGNAFDIIVLSVNTSDFLCGTYLLALVSANAYFDDSFLVNEKNWRKHHLCFCIFLLSCLFAMSSAITLLIISVSRLMVVLYPMESNFKRKSYVTKLVTSCIVTCLILSILFTLTHRFVSSEAPFVLCLPTIDPTNSNVLIKFVTFFLSLTQISCAIGICVVYCVLIRTLVKKSKEASLQKSKERSNAGMITQLIIITLSNLLCWIPSDVIFIVSQFVSNYPVDMVIWISIAVTPVNSILNPAVLLFMKLKSHLTSHKTPAVGNN